MTKEKIHLKDIREDVQNREEKIIIVGDNKYWADRTNKDNYATHDDCNVCGTEFEKRFTHDRKCEDCKHKAESERYNSLELKEWDGDTPLTLYSGDQYFFDTDDILFFCEDQEAPPEEFRFILCKPTSFRSVDFDYWQDDLHEDWEPSKEFEDKLKKFNEFLKSEPTNTWFPDKYRVTITSEDIEYKPEENK